MAARTGVRQHSGDEFPPAVAVVTSPSLTRFLRPFGDWAETALANGYIPIPVSGKRPSIKNWNKRPLGQRGIAKLLAQPNIASENLAFRTGELVAVDIDHDNRVKADRVANTALGIFGPDRVSSASGELRGGCFFTVEKPK